MMEKQRQRQYLKEVRGGIPKAVREEKSSKIARRLFCLDDYKAASSVMIYMSFGSEVETSEISERIMSDGKRLVVPHCKESCLMDGYFISDLSCLERGRYGILEPSRELIRTGAIRLADKRDIDLVIVPGLGFDKEGFRIGYGMGYYDRYLSDFGGRTVGLCFSECILGSVFHNEYDRKIDTVLTDSAVYGV